MRLRAALITLVAMPALAGAPALAHGGGAVAPGPWGWSGGMGMGGWQQPYVVHMPEQQVAPPPQHYDREGWLRECRRRLADNGLGGAVIGGVLGGAAGNAIAAHGDKVLGTVAGAVAGAVAGSAIDKAEDRAASRDRCEVMLEGGPTYAGGYAPAGYMMVPVMMVPVQGTTQPQDKRNCKETVVTEEFVTYEPRRSRHIPRRAPDKRVRMVPDKRVPQ